MFCNKWSKLDLWDFFLIIWNAIMISFEMLCSAWYMLALWHRWQKHEKIMICFGLSIVVLCYMESFHLRLNVFNCAVFPSTTIDTLLTLTTDRKYHPLWITGTKWVALEPKNMSDLHVYNWNNAIVFSRMKCKYCKI